MAHRSTKLFETLIISPLPHQLLKPKFSCFNYRPYAQYDGRLCFHTCLSIHRGRWRGTPVPGNWAFPRGWGWKQGREAVRGRKYPSQDQDRGTPSPGKDQNRTIHPYPVSEGISPDRTGDTQFPRLAMMRAVRLFRSHRRTFLFTNKFNSIPILKVDIDVLIPTLSQPFHE